jgi:1-acyl-sn-glycerol-3-phosphate acyltransferase
VTDAKVIAMDGDRPRTPGARSVLIGADRASGERARRRRRTTPLLAGSPAEPDPVADPDAEPDSAAAAAAERATPKPVAATQAAPRKATPRKATVKKTAAAKKAGAKKVVPTGKPVAPTSVPTGKPVVAPKAVPTGKPAAAAPKSVPTGKPAVGKPAVLTDEFLPPDDEPVPAGGRHSIAMALVAQAGEALLGALIGRDRPAEIEAKVAAVLGFLGRRLTGEYELDEFGFDAEFAEAVPLLLLRPLYRHWFRVEVRGIENLPLNGGALIVANHSGAVPIDALMTAVAVHEEHPEHRFLRTLGADLVFQTPFLAGLARRAGATLASNPDAERLLSDGHLVGVWPEGFKGIGKPFTERYKLQRFGRGGFVSAALRTGTPIIPCSIVGAEETYPIIGNVPSLARLLGLPYLPITPFFPLLGPLGAIPLPSKWLIEFGTPVLTDGYDAGAAEDPMLVFDLTDQIRQSIQQTLYSLLVQRRSIFF